MKKRLFAVSLAAALLLSGCGGGKSSSGAAPGEMMDHQASTSAPDSTGWGGGMEEGWEMPSAGAPSPEESGLYSSVYQNPDAKLIRRAELEIQTEQFDESEKALKQAAASCGGYLENASVYGGSRRDAYAARQGEYVVRVPSEKYSQFFQSAGDLGYVTSSSESSENVGEEYYDIEARLKTQRTKQERLLSLLEKAESMEDIIALESALSDVEYQIELYSTDLRRYDALIGFSTFRIYLYEVGRVTQEVGETASLGQRMAAGFQSSLRGLGDGFQNFLVWSSYHIFLLIVLAAAAAAAVYVGRREWKKRTAPKTRKPDGED